MPCCSVRSPPHTKLSSWPRCHSAVSLHQAPSLHCCAACGVASYGHLLEQDLLQDEPWQPNIEDMLPRGYRQALGACLLGPVLLAGEGRESLKW